MQSLKALLYLSQAFTNTSPLPTNKAQAHPHIWVATHSNSKLHPAIMDNLNTSIHKIYIKTTILPINRSSLIPSQ